MRLRLQSGCPPAHYWAHRFSAVEPGCTPERRNNQAMRSKDRNEMSGLPGNPWEMGRLKLKMHRESQHGASGLSDMF